MEVIFSFDGSGPTIPGALFAHFVRRMMPCATGQSIRWVIVADILTLSGASVEQYADILSEVAGAVQAGDIGLAEERLEPIIDHVWQGHLPLHAPPGRGPTCQGWVRPVAQSKSAV